jgi:hypothetical protein
LHLTPALPIPDTGPATHVSTQSVGDRLKAAALAEDLRTWTDELTTAMV